jgi:Tetracyclin repressor-like, C-terminal domain
MTLAPLRALPCSPIGSIFRGVLVPNAYRATSIPSSAAAVAAAAVERLALQTIDIPESGTLRGDLDALLTSAVTVFTDGTGRFVPRLIRESGHDGEIADLLDTVIHTRRLAYRRVVNRAIARHELDPDIDQDLLIDLLVGPIWTRLLIIHDPITENLIDEIVAAITRAFPAAS